MLTRDQRLILIDGAFFSFMVGIGETYLPAFALALGMSQVRAGLLVTVPLLIGALLQLVSPFAVQRLGSHRTWVMLTVAVQAASFLPLTAAALIGQAPDWLIFTVAAIYWGAGLAAGPAWTTWVATLVPVEIRPRYFAHRNRISQTGLLLGLSVGGGLLMLGDRLGMGPATFAAMFLLASICRFISARLIYQQSEPMPMPAGHRPLSPSEASRRFQRNGVGRLVLYLLTMQIAVFIAHPYFTPYVLEQLRVDRFAYALLIGAPYLARILALPFLGRIAHRRGARAVLLVASIGFVALAGMWLSGRSTAWLVLAQLFGGVAWAAWELSQFLLMLESVEQADRTSVMSYYNVGDALSKTGGSLIGGRLLYAMHETAAAYLAVFTVSLIARAAVLLWPRGPTPARDVSSPSR